MHVEHSGALADALPVHQTHGAQRVRVPLLWAREHLHALVAGPLAAHQRHLLQPISTRPLINVAYTRNVVRQLLNKY